MSVDKHPKSSTARVPSASQDANYFDISAPSPGPPFLFLTFAAPSNNAYEPPRSTPWERAMQDGAFTNSTSPSGSAVDRQRVNSLSATTSKFGVDPPRPPREGYE
ncbi:uncharacterized protein TrAFT101_001529 [Trichoderma asperellum]|uniref:Uncharacterized protein n=1 Tax=Trichoderma asperellum (strain ATCC 204424 / CBS 433.97 / NBRC 101777) TaxID=1042311 RepID=A0A2T3ZDT5_TRIA4|nr:hypothetical protein M441DRAFT_25072 [Trichoderma asperellum CBS 433.97]PTB42959.1 hypothetical protein M441DRAFT_25072 [Trichoderma asperellum CBS 433.97]UKZ85680.1 hypothetical protein TrAFT101_001529 [Trichoderma asperellum]